MDEWISERFYKFVMRAQADHNWVRPISREVLTLMAAWDEENESAQARAYFRGICYRVLKGSKS